jgi:hypothetical protein
MTDNTRRSLAEALSMPPGYDDIDFDPPRMFDNQDRVSWGTDQAALLRAGRLKEIDVERIASEIESAGNVDRMELADRVGSLLTHLLKWQYQPALMSQSSLAIIALLRKRVQIQIGRFPNLTPMLEDETVLADIYAQAVVQALTEEIPRVPPPELPWAISDVLDANWMPQQEGNDDGKS